MAYTDVWDVTAPLDSQAAAQGAADFRATKLDVMQRVASFGAGILANRPTPELTGATADWTGVMYWATDTAQVFRWSGAAWVDISADIPSSIVNSFFTAGILQIIHGGTGTATPALVAGGDISITGAWPDQTVAVATQGGVTPGAYTNTDLTVDSHGIITAIASNAAGSVAAAVDVVNQLTSIGTTTLLAVPALPATGTNYLLTWNAKITTTEGGGAGIDQPVFVYTDPDGTVITINASGIKSNGTTVLVNSGLSGASAGVSYIGYAMILNCSAGTNITYAIGATSFTNALRFNFHVRLVQL